MGFFERSALEVDDRGAVTTWTFRATGPGRFFVVAFVAVWLAGWAVGEYFVGWMLVGLVSGALRTEAPPWPGALAGGAFLLGWFALWTLAGVASVWQVLRALAGRDVVALEPGGLRFGQTLAGLAPGRFVAREALRDVRLRKRVELVLDTDAGTFALTRLGTADERARLAEAIRRRFGLVDDDALPGDWRVQRLADGSFELEQRFASRAGCGVTALALAAIAGVAAWRWLAGDSELVVGGVLAAAGALLCLPFVFGRDVWNIRPGRVERRRQWLAWRRVDVVHGGALAVRSSQDSDGDWSYVLEVGADGGESRRIASGFDVKPVLTLARWIARTAGLRLDVDRDARRG